MVHGNNGIVEAGLDSFVDSYAVVPLSIFDPAERTSQGTPEIFNTTFCTTDGSKEAGSVAPVG